MGRSLELLKGKIDFVWMGEDLGTQIGPLISLDLFRKHIRPRHQRVIDVAKSFGLPVMIHTCGSSSWAYDDFIEMGISAVDTLQPEAAKMDPAYLKGRYGSRLMLHGCISTAAGGLWHARGGPSRCQREGRNPQPRRRVLFLAHASAAGQLAG